MFDAIAQSVRAIQLLSEQSLHMAMTIATQRCEVQVTGRPVYGTDEIICSIKAILFPPQSQELYSI